MPHPVIHAEIRSEDPDATRQFYADLFGWTVASEGAFPGYTFIDTGVEGGTYVAISPRHRRALDRSEERAWGVASRVGDPIRMPRREVRARGEGSCGRQWAGQPPEPQAGESVMSETTAPR